MAQRQALKDVLNFSQYNKRKIKLFNDIDSFTDEIQQKFFSSTSEEILRLTVASDYNKYYNRFHKHVILMMNMWINLGTARLIRNSFWKIVEEYVDCQLLPAIENALNRHDSAASLPNIWEDYGCRLRLFCDATKYFFISQYGTRLKSRSLEQFSHKICEQKIVPALEKKIEESFESFLSRTEGINGFFSSEPFTQLIDSSLWSELEIGRIYKPQLEAFIRSFDEYYQEKRRNFMQISDEKERMAMAEKCLREEAERLEKFFDPETKQLLKGIAENEMIQLKFDTRITERNVYEMLENDDKTELKDICDLLFLYDKDEAYSIEMFGYVYEYFCENNQELIDRLEAKNDSEAKNFVANLMDFFDKYNEFFREQFGEHSHKSSKYLGKAFIEMINNQARAAELLASFMDSKLRVKSAKSDGDEEDRDRRILSKLALVLEYLEDKEVFMKYYVNFMRKRLLNERSKSEELEMLMFQKLEEVFGTMLTGKLQAMLRDYQNCKIYQSKFEDYLEGKNIQLNIPLNIRVLTTIHWVNKPPVPFKLPQNMNTAFEEFRKFYQEKHPSRKLTLWHDVGTVDMKGIFFRNGKKFEYIMTMSAYQAAILMLFQDSDCLTLEQIQQQTDIKKDDLVSFITPLVNEKILISIGNDKDILAEKSEFKLNNDFSSKHKRIRLPKGFKAENKVSRAEEKEIAAVRQNQMDAAIVRVMKAGKSMTLAELTAQVITQLAGFKPDPTVIRKRVDVLIERNFLAMKNDAVYEYVC